MVNFYEISGEIRQVPDYLPMSAEELDELGISTPDIVIVTGDAYVDHPSFGAALIGKLLWAKGYSAAVIAAPNVNDPDALAVFGKPRLAFYITSGNVDSMVNNYTAALRRRSDDQYAENGIRRRPDRALEVYCGAAKALYPDTAVVAGGLEASLRRLAHYDYWSGKVRRSILINSGADLLVFGMGERQTLEIADALASGVLASDINYIDGTVYKTSEYPREAIILPSYETVKSDKSAYAESFRRQYNNMSWQTAKPLAEYYRRVSKEGLWVAQNPPSVPLTTQEMDVVYGLRFTRTAHPSYKDNVPSANEVKFSITSSRGCFGACAFCALTFHQGKQG